MRQWNTDDADATDGDGTMQPFQNLAREVYDVSEFGGAATDLVKRGNDVDSYFGGSR